jgi:hypothetical protein
MYHDDDNDDNYHTQDLLMNYQEISTRTPESKNARQSRPVEPIVPRVRWPEIYQMTAPINPNSTFLSHICLPGLKDPTFHLLLLFALKNLIFYHFNNIISLILSSNCYLGQSEDQSCIKMLKIYGPHRVVVTLCLPFGLFEP